MPWLSACSFFSISARFHGGTPSHLASRAASSICALAASSCAFCAFFCRSRDFHSAMGPACCGCCCCCIDAGGAAVDGGGIGCENP